MNIFGIGTTDILGGAAKVSWEIKSALEKKGSQMDLFVADKRSDDERVHVIPRSGMAKYASLILGTETVFKTDWLLETPEFKHADLVHAHNLHGRFFNLNTLASMSQRKPVVWTLHDEWAITPHCAYTLEEEKQSAGFFLCPSIQTQPRLLWDCSARLSRQKKSAYDAARLHVVTPSRWLYNRVKKSVLATQQLHHIPNGIDSATFTPSDMVAARQQLGLPQDKKIVLFLAVDAKNNTWKGWRYAQEVVEAYGDREDVLFVNVGNLTQHDDEDRVIYRPHISDPSELALYYSAADCLLFTSIAENFPLVVLEAMSTGLPAVAFRVGGVPEIVAHKENGWVSDYRDAGGLVRGVEYILGLSLEERRALRQRNIELIRSKYDVYHMVDAYLALYKSLL